MITTIICIALIGTLQFNSAILAAINYEPIKITVNEDFNAQPGQVSPELQEPAHQGANFYYKPQLNLPPSYIPSNIEGLISLIQQHHHSCSKDASKLVVEKDKLIEILRPSMYPMSEISKETLSEIVLEKENNLEIVRPIIITDELKPVTPEFLLIPEAPELPPLSFNGTPPIVEVIKEESVILEESTDMFPTIPEIAMRPITEPIINYVEPKPITSGLVVIPEAPVLPPLSANNIHVIEEEVKIEEPTIVEVEPKPAIEELVAIPEAPVLPSLPLHDISSIIEEEAKKEESVIFEDQVGVFSTIPEICVRSIEEPIINYVEPKLITSELVVIPKAPVLSSLSFNDIPPIVEEVKKEESIILEESIGVLPEPSIIEVEPKPFTSKLVVIPIAPVLPPISLHDILSIADEEVKKNGSIIFEKPIGKFPLIPELAVRPIPEQIIDYVKPKPIISEFLVIPEGPVFPPLSFNDIPPIVEEEMKKGESIILEEPAGVFPTIPEIAVRPITEPIFNYVEPTPIKAELVVIPEAPMLPPLSANNIQVVEEEIKIQEPIVVDVEPKPVIQELVAISEAPVLPSSLSLHDISSIIEEELKIEEPIVVDVEPKPVIQELVAIPEAPVLPSLSLHDICSIIEEEVKKEESVIFEEPMGVFPTIPEITVRPIQEQIINYAEPKLITSEVVAIPEAPVLPQLSYNGIPPVVEDVKIEEPIQFEESTGIFPSISEISARPFPEPLVVSETAESFALENHIFPIATEEVKIEVPILFEESIQVFPPTAEIYSGPTLHESDITDSYVLEEVSQPNPESVVTIKETLPLTIIPKPSNNMGVFSYVPFVSHLSNRAPKTKKLMIPKPASVERFLLKKHPLKLPVTPFPKLDLNAIKSSLGGNIKKFLYPTSYAHDVVEKHIAPNMAFKKQNAPKRLKNYIRSNVPKGPSYL